MLFLKTAPPQLQLQHRTPHQPHRPRQPPMLLPQLLPSLLSLPHPLLRLLPRHRLLLRQEVLRLAPVLEVVVSVLALASAVLLLFRLLIRALVLLEECRELLLCLPWHRECCLILGTVVMIDIGWIVSLYRPNRSGLLKALYNKNIFYFARLFRTPCFRSYLPVR